MKNKNKNKHMYKYKYEELLEAYYHTSKYQLQIGLSTILHSGKGVFTNEYIERNTFIDYYYGNGRVHILLDLKMVVEY